MTDRDDIRRRLGADAGGIRAGGESGRSDVERRTGVAGERGEETPPGPDPDFEAAAIREAVGALVRPRINAPYPVALQDRVTIYVAAGRAAGRTWPDLEQATGLRFSVLKRWVDMGAGRAQASVSETVRFLRGAERAVSPSEVAAQFGISEKAAGLRLTRGAERGLIKRIGRGQYVAAEDTMHGS